MKVSVKQRTDARLKAQKHYGDIKKMLCSVLSCSNWAKEIHHINYEKPYDVILLCKKHHKKLHDIWKEK